MKTIQAKLALAALPALLCLCGTAGAAELKVLSQGLPAASYTGSRKPVSDAAAPEKAFDGARETGWCVGPAYPAALTVDLGDNYNVIKVMSFMEKPHVWYSYIIEVSPDQKAWSVFADQTKNQEPSEDPAYTDMGGVTGRYVRITLTDVAEKAKSWFWPVIMEFQVYGVPVENPAEKPVEKTP